MRPARFLHLHSTFSLGGKEARAVRLMNAFGDAAHHTILSAVPGAMGARDAIAPGIVAHFPTDAPSLEGLPGLPRYRRLARFMAGFDLVLTYNWGAMDGVMARRAFAPVMRLPPLIHHEDGFNADEIDGPNMKRVWFRRLGLPTSYKVVVPSRRLEAVARKLWRQPVRRVLRIGNGIAVDDYVRPPQPGVIPGFVRHEGEVVIGTIAGLREVKNLPKLVAAMTRLPEHVRLVIAGEGPERSTLEAQIARLGLGRRVSLAGFLDRPWRFVGAFDIVALSSLSEQFPIAVLEGMAAGLPIASTDVGDVATMIAPENSPYVVAPSDDAALVDALRSLSADPSLRATIGAANRLKARLEYDEATMIADYANLYQSALGPAGSLSAHLPREPL